MWILIMTMIGYGRTSNTTAEFSTQAKCVAAATQWRTSTLAMVPSLQLVTVCAEK